MTNTIEIAEQVALTKLEELTKDKPAGIIYTLSKEVEYLPTSGRSLLEFVYSPDRAPYPEGGKIRNWSIAIVVDASLMKVEYYQIGDNAFER